MYQSARRNECKVLSEFNCNRVQYKTSAKLGQCKSKRVQSYVSASQKEYKIKEFKAMTVQDETSAKNFK